MVAGLTGLIAARARKSALGEVHVGSSRAGLMPVLSRARRSATAESGACVAGACPSWAGWCLPWADIHLPCADALSTCHQLHLRVET